MSGQRGTHPGRPCRDCGQPQEDDHYPGRRCKPCHAAAGERSRRANPENQRARQRQSYATNGEKKRAEHRAWYARKRTSVIDAYGGRCSSCGTDDRRVLDLDHVEGGGSQHHKNRGPTGVYVDVIQEGFPATYRLLCRNCNWIAWLTKKDEETLCPA